MCNNNNGMHGFSLHGPDVDCHNKCTGISDRDFQLKQGDTCRCCPGDEIVFCSIYIYAASVYRPDSFQITQ